VGINPEVFWWVLYEFQAGWWITRSEVLIDRGSDIAHTVTINGVPSHWYNIIVKSTKTLQFWHISHGYLNPWHSTTRILISAQNFYDIKNKHQSIWANSSFYISNSLFHHNLTHCLAHCLAHRLSIARYCFRFAPLFIFLYYLSLFHMQCTLENTKMSYKYHFVVIK
jgi:hypothetical protein